MKHFVYDHCFLLGRGPPPTRGVVGLRLKRGHKPELRESAAPLLLDVVDAGRSQQQTQPLLFALPLDPNVALSVGTNLRQVLCVVRSVGVERHLHADFFWGQPHPLAVAPNEAGPNVRIAGVVFYHVFSPRFDPLGFLLVDLHGSKPAGAAPLHVVWPRVAGRLRAKKQHPVLVAQHLVEPCGTCEVPHCGTRQLDVASWFDEFGCSVEIKLCHRSTVVVGDPAPPAGGKVLGVGVDTAHLRKECILFAVHAPVEGRDLVGVGLGLKFVVDSHVVLL